jgi:hypothetical protein
MRSWKPRQRAEYDQWWQDLQPGHASSTVGEAPGDEYFAAMLYLPSPGSRTGWQLHGVERKQDERPRPPLGFGRGG